MPAPTGGEGDGGEGVPPLFSALQAHTHWQQHHREHLRTCHTLLADSVYAGRPLEEVVCETALHAGDAALHHHAAQHWNHSFFWRCLRAGGSPPMPPTLQQALQQDFGSVEAFRQEFEDSAMQVFGSGWTWLVADHHGVLRDEAQEDGEGEGEETGDNDVTSAEKKTPPLLRVMNTTNSSNPMLLACTPLLVLDVWEHSYYLDYQNRRGEYVANFWKTVDWEFVDRNLSLC